jgi:hypothetical protein
MRFEMWRAVERSASAGGQRVSRYTFVVGWATAKWIVQARVLSQQDDQCVQSRLVSEPLAKLDQSLRQW